MLLVEEPNQSISDILKVPVQRRKVKQRNLKLHHGIMSGNEVIESVEELEVEKAQEEKEKEADTIAKLRREKDISDLEQKLCEDRDKLKQLKTKNIEAKKETVSKKKQKLVIKRKRGNQLVAPVIANEDSKIEIMKEVATKKVKNVKIKLENERNIACPVSLGEPKPKRKCRNVRENLYKE